MPHSGYQKGNTQLDMIIEELPIAGFPKPGEEVIWFSRNRKIEGKLIGYDTDEKPIITDVTQDSIWPLEPEVL